MTKKDKIKLVKLLQFGFDIEYKEKADGEMLGIVLFTALEEMRTKDEARRLFRELINELN